jgi:hypothetical protein
VRIYLEFLLLIPEHLELTQKLIDEYERRMHHQPFDFAFYRRAKGEAAPRDGAVRIWTRPRPQGDLAHDHHARPA